MTYKEFIKSIITIVSISSIPLLIQFWWGLSQGHLWGLSCFIGSGFIIGFANAVMWDKWK